MFDRTDALWREEPTPAPAETSARDAKPTVDQARQVNAPAAPPRTRTINTMSTARTGRTARQTPTATDTRASSPPQKHAPRRTAIATTPPRPRPATSG